MQIELEPDVVLNLATLAYGKWSEADDILKAVKAETDDGSPDWIQFHALRKYRAEQRWNETKRVSDAISEQARPILEQIMEN